MLKGWLPQRGHGEEDAGGGSRAGGFQAVAAWRGSGQVSDRGLGREGCKYRPSLFRRDALCDAKGLTAVRRGLAPLLEKRWVAQVRNYCGKPMYGEFREFAADIAPAIAAAYEAFQLTVF